MCGLPVQRVHLFGAYCDGSPHSSNPKRKRTQCDQKKSLIMESGAAFGPTSLLPLAVLISMTGHWAHCV
jgi:hypothetical protein